MHARTAAVLVLTLLGACTWIDQEAYDERRDADQDGVSGDVDCNDDDADVGLADIWYRDADGDGAGAPLDTTTACARPEGYVANGTDCDDADPAVAPDALEVCSGRDDDCDGLVDDLDPSLSGDVPQWLPDVDSDGFPASFDAPGVVLVASCLAPDGHLPVPSSAADYDCDDSDAMQSPDGIEQCDGLDNDCNGQTDEATDPDDPLAVLHIEDADADGWPPEPDNGLDVRYACAVPPGRTALSDYEGLVERAEQIGRTVVFDCDDTNDELAPDVFDVPYDGVDADCQGNDDDDYDGDGFAAATEGGQDCDDLDALVHPDADETCATPYDDNCDGDVNTPDITDSAVFLMLDADLDGWPVDDVERPQCVREAGWTDRAAYEDLLTASGLDAAAGAVVFDCADDNPNWYPGAPDAPYNTVDEDCQVDSDYDFDDDGEESALERADGTDCDDFNPDIATGLPERCDTPFDDNCDGLTNVPDLITGVEVQALPDADGDGWPESLTAVALCAVTTGYVTEADYLARRDELIVDRPGIAVLIDCDDDDPTRHPAQPDTPYDGIDADCQGDDDFDVDGDGERSAAESDDGTDCDDENPAVNTAARETCATPYDDDCDGDTTQSGFAGEGIQVRPDADADGWPAEGTNAVRRCTVEPGWTSIADYNALVAASSLAPGDIDEDCADDDPNRHPDLFDAYYDGVDTDCQGDDDFDADGDGQQALVAVGGTDCDDANPAVRVGALETCATPYDDDCDGSSEDPVVGGEAMLVDADADGWPLNDVPVDRCTLSAGWMTEAAYEATLAASGLNPVVDEVLDCDDGLPQFNPGQFDTPYDGDDADCQGDSDYDADDDGYDQNDPVAPDCGDNDPLVYPGAPERCASVGIDDDCDGQVDERGAPDGVRYYIDDDSDGYATGPAAQVTACADDDTLLSPLELIDLGDCDDTDATIYPTADEVPDDGIDQDCSGLDAITCYVDGDSDGVAGDDVRVDLDGTCADADLFPAPGGDCDDADPDIRPNQKEFCDLIDNNCDGVLAPALTGYPIDPNLDPVDLEGVPFVDLSAYARVSACGGTWSPAWDMLGASANASLVLEGLSMDGDDGPGFARPVLEMGAGGLFSGLGSGMSLTVSGVDIVATAPDAALDLSDLAELTLSDVSLEGDQVVLVVGSEEGPTTLDVVDIRNTGVPTDDGLQVKGDADANSLTLGKTGVRVLDGVLDADVMVVEGASLGVTVRPGAQLAAAEASVKGNSQAAMVEGTLTLRDSEVRSNDGHVFVEKQGTFSASNVDFLSNSDVYGGAVQGMPDSVVVITDGTFQDNSGDYGGAVMLQGVSAVVSSSFSDNAATYGGAAWLEGNATFSGVTLSLNDASVGGALHVGDSGLLAAQGVGNAAITSVVGTSLRVDRNTAEAGGCFAVFQGDMVLLGGRMAECTAQALGGGLWVGDGATVALEGTSVATSTAVVGGAAYVDGELEICGGLFDANSADVTGGGALYVNNFGFVGLGDATFESNLSKTGPLAVVEADAEIAVGSVPSCDLETPSATGHDNPSIVVRDGGLLSGTGWKTPAGRQEWLDEATGLSAPLP